MSNRVVIIKILGLGDTDSTQPAVFTTRPQSLYYSKLEGTVVSLTDQLSSEIAVFGSLGSDSTTSFTVLSTPDTRRILMSRGKREVFDAVLNQPVRTTGYISPAAGTVTIPVPTPGLFTIGNYYRIQNTVFQITSNTSTLEGIRVWGCADVPIPMTSQGVNNEALGAIVYDLNNGNPLGGCEQLPVVIETVEQDGLQSEVIFRGYINKVSNDTSSGQTNLIKVDCSSLMAYIKAAPFIPAWGPVTANTITRQGRIYDHDSQNNYVTNQYTTNWQADLFGEVFDENAPVAGATRVRLWQIRQEGRGGINVPYIDTFPTRISLLGETELDFDDGAVALNNSYLMCFNAGFYDNGAYGPDIQMSFDLKKKRDGKAGRAWTSEAVQQQDSIRGENCVESNDFVAAIVDLLLGTYEADLTLSQGARSATEAAWLPFPSTAIDDLIDTPSLYALAARLNMPDIPKFIPGRTVSLAEETRTLLPYEHASVKTVGDVLDGILKRLGAYMVCDKGKFYFGSWAGKRQTPIFVNDTALSDPSIKLSFDRGMCLMRVNAKYCVNLYEDAETYDVPYLNVDLASSALGKEMSISHWQAGNVNPDDPFWGDSRMVANAFGLLMRYSQSAARVDVSLRDSVKDLKVGQEIALTSSYLVNSEGELGISALLGYVLKAARSWQTPTTAYTIILPGYLSPAVNLAVWSCSGKVALVPGGDDIEIDVNEFTLPLFIAPDGAPYADAQAFENTLNIYGGPIAVQLLDQYGTLKATGTLSNVTGNLLTIPGFDAYAVPGDIIVLDSATSIIGGGNTIYDVFLADNSAQVAGSTDNARKWVP